MIHVMIVGSDAGTEDFRKYVMQQPGLVCTDDYNRAEAAYLADGSDFFRAASVLAAGRHLLCRSLAAFTLRELDTLAALADRHQVTLGEYPLLSRSAGFLRLKDSLNQAGMIRRAGFQCCSYSGTGAMRDCVRLMVELFGQPDRITPDILTSPDGVSCGAAATARYGEVQVELLCSARSGSHVSNRIQGDRGVITFQNVCNPGRICFTDRQGRRVMASGETGSCNRNSCSRAAHSGLAGWPEQSLGRNGWPDQSLGRNDWHESLQNARTTALVMESMNLNIPENRRARGVERLNG